MGRAKRASQARHTPLSNILNAASQEAKAVSPVSKGEWKAVKAKIFLTSPGFDPKAYLAQVHRHTPMRSLQRGRAIIPERKI